MVDVRYATDDDRQRWDRRVEQSPQGSPFHCRGALEVMADHSGATMHLLVGYKGQEPVGLFPLFESSRGPLTAVSSPPPDLKVSYGGPLLLNFAKLKRRKAEKRHARFVDGCIELIEADLDPDIVHVRTAVGYDDARSFAWNDFELTPRYTYVVDLTPGPDSLLAAFSSDARRNVRNGHAADSEIQEGGPAAIRRIIDQVKTRHDEQDEAYRVSPAFVIDLYRTLPEGTVRPYTCTVGGTFVGGMVALEFDDTVYRWQGGAKTDSEIPVNDLVDWRIIRDAMDRGLTRYDLIGANNRRISGYKSKFSPSLELYHEMEKGSRPMRAAASLYNWLR